MKKMFAVVACFAVLLGSTAAFADDDTKVTVGVKSWYNWWSHSVDYADGTSHTWNNGSAFMVGPSLNIKAGKVFLGGTYLQSISDYKASDWRVANDTMKFERKDLDLTLGYMFVPYFGAFIGYKSIDAPMTYTNASGIPNSAYDGTWKMKGPGIGIMANAPLGRSAALYGNLAFLRVKQEFDYSTGTTSSFDMTGASFEFGTAIAFSQSVSSNVGFKYQTFWGDSAAGDTHHQNFYGLTLGLNYTF